MAQRYYGLDRGESKNSVTEGSGSTATTDAEVRVDLAAGMSRSEVLLALDIIASRIVESIWPPEEPPVPDWSIAGPTTIDEGGTASYTVSYTGAELLFNESAYVTVNAVTGDATEGADFAEVSPTLLTFTNSASAQTVSVAVTDDTTTESAEAYTVVIAGVSFGDIDSGTATTTINASDA